MWLIKNLPELKDRYFLQTPAKYHLLQERRTARFEAKDSSGPLR